MEKEIIITKASGDREPFSEVKLRRSLERARASSDLVNVAVEEIKDGLREGMNTLDIYTRAFSLLRKKQRPVAVRYRLKRALRMLPRNGKKSPRMVRNSMKHG